MLLVASLALVAGCDLDVQNPNALGEDEVFGDDEGMLALVVGMQDLFGENVEEFVQGSALVTDEWGTGTRSLPAYRTLLTGVAIDPELGIIEEPWGSAYQVVNAADQVIEGAEGSGLSPNGVAAVVAVAKLFRGMSLGVLTLQFDQLIIDPDAEPNVLVSRDEALEEVLAVLESARSDLAQLSSEDLAFLQSRVLGSGFDPINTTNAMLARYYLVDGQLEQAIEAAERVDLSVLSTLPYRAPDANPICSLSVCELQYVFPLASFADQAEPGDQRVSFWVDTTAEPFAGNPDSLLLPLAQYDVRTESFLVYVPDEMTLIRAEAHARLGDLATARELVNEVRTRTTVEPVAGLPALPETALDTEAEILTQILYERRYELYEQGLRWEDVRRLSEFTDVEPTIQFFPVPQDECRTNPDLGC